jgi:citrate lyase subunit alpha/citrate CoA-transferase
MSAGKSFETNAVGRRVPKVVNQKKQVAFEGVGKHEPVGVKHGPPIRSCKDYPDSGDKRVPDLRTALERCGLSDGMVISSHQHLRNGDQVALAALEAAAGIGVKDLMWFPSASFQCHAPVIDLMDQGVVHHIEGSMNGPLGE